MNCAMVIYTDRAYTEGSLNQYIQIGLVPLNEQFIPYQQNGITTIYAPEQVSDFQERIGKNTAYAIDPGRSIGRQFSYVLFGKADLIRPAVSGKTWQKPCSRKYDLGVQRHEKHRFFNG